MSGLARRVTDELFWLVKGGSVVGRWCKCETRFLSFHFRIFVAMISCYSVVPIVVVGSSFFALNI